MAHFAHYVQRRVVLRLNRRLPNDPWFKLHALTDQGLAAPRYHVTRARGGAATRVRVGDTIWLLSELRTPWGRKLPPALDARLVVAEVLQRHDRPGTLKFVAGVGSRWFPLYDATEAIAALRTTDAQGRVRKLVSNAGQPIGQALQSMRQLATAEPLQTLERRIARRKHEFVSYRLKSGTRMAFEAASSLLERGIPVWWDRWSLPRGLAERRESLKDAALAAFIRMQIRDSKVVWGIHTADYAEEDSYSREERDEALARGTFRIWPQSRKSRARRAAQKPAKPRSR
jgi:hypothetical protein